MVQEMTLRETYLKQTWMRYPAMPAQCWIRGRITDVNLTQIKLDNGSVFEVKNAQMSEGDNNIQSLLNEGDLVSVNQVENTYIVTLLAPHLDQSIPSIPSEIIEKWNLFLNQIRQFFFTKKFLEIQTPTLVNCPGTEVYVDAYAVEKKFLPTSPEIHLKKALACGYEKIFEIKNCFRKEEVTEHHQPEFYMLEWYRAFADLSSIKQDLIDLVHVLDRNQIVQIKNMQQLFLEQGMELSPKTTKEEFAGWAKNKNLHTHTSDTIDDLFFRIFVELIEPKLPKQPLIIENYPPFQAAYARIRPDGWADRFEFYWNGLEVANAFHEVNDPELQEIRMRTDLEKKQALGRKSVNLDPQFFQALKSGMPPSGGIALGLERLFMAQNNLSKIQDLKLFPVRNLTGE